jgi:hypothetical protein
MSGEFAIARIKQVTKLGVSSFMLHQGYNKLVSHFGEQQGSDFFIRLLNVIEVHDRNVHSSMTRTMNSASTSTLANYIFDAIESEGGLSMKAEEFDLNLKENLELKTWKVARVAGSMGGPSP